MYALARDPFDPSESFGATFATTASLRRLGMPKQGPEGNSASDIMPLPIAAAPSVHSTLLLLRRLRKYTPNSDPASFKLAEEFLGLASSTRRGFSFSAQVFAEGNAVVVLRGNNIDAQFEFMPDGTIAANVDIGDREWDADITGFDGRSLPKAIANQLHSGA